MKKILKFLFLLLRTGDPGKAWFFADWQGASNLQLLHEVLLLSGRRIQYIPTGAVFTGQTIHLFANSLSLFRQSASTYRATETEGQLWLATNFQGQQIKACMANTNSLLCMHEVFGMHAYQALGIGPCVAVDIGMNIGLSSLYLAALPQVEAVYSYELVGSTTLLAKANMAANTYAASKVKIFHNGVAASDQIINITLTGTGDVGAHVHMHQENALTETVQLIGLTNIIETIHHQHPGLPILLKMDCEGSEYDIIPLLKTRELHPYIHVLIIEWHVRGSQFITDILKACGYICFTPGIVAAQPTGFVYAVKNHLYQPS